jgi:hypothetical protein
MRLHRGPNIHSIATKAIQLGHDEHILLLQAVEQPSEPGPLRRCD